MSRRRSQVRSRNGSSVRSRVSRFWSKGRRGVAVVGLLVRAAREGGNAGVLVGGGVGSWCRNEVSRCELCTVTGSSVRMS